MLNVKHGLTNVITVDTKKASNHINDYSKVFQSLHTLIDDVNDLKTDLTTVERECDLCNALVHINSTSHFINIGGGDG